MPSTASPASAPSPPPSPSTQWRKHLKGVLRLTTFDNCPHRWSNQCHVTHAGDSNTSSDQQQHHRGSLRGTAAAVGLTLSSISIDRTDVQRVRSDQSEKSCTEVTQVCVCVSVNVCFLPKAPDKSSDGIFSGASAASSYRFKGAHNFFCILLSANCSSRLTPIS